MRWSPIIALRGDVEGNRMKRKLGGTLTEDLTVQVIDTPCQEREPGQALTDLLTSIHAEDGASVRSQTITYSYDGRPDTARSEWWFVICGEAVTQDDSCVTQ
jgi:ornithine carbamoyltransferase